MARMVGKMNVKNKAPSKKFNDEAHYQGSKKVPLPARKEYGTGLPVKKPSKKK